MDAVRPAVVVALVASLLAIAPSALARRVRVTCVDGIPNPLVLAYQEQPYCDFDHSCNGECTFAFCTLDDFLCSVRPGCVGPGNGVCAPNQEPADTIVVPAGERRVLRASTVHAVGLKVVLRCRPTPGGLPCPAPSPGACALQPGPPGPICGGGCTDASDQCLFDPTTMMCRCVPPSAACEQQLQSQCAVGLCPSPVGECQDIGSACACPIP